MAILSMSSVPPTGCTLTPEAAATAATSAKTSSAMRRMGRCDRSLPSGTPPMAPSVVVTQLIASFDRRTLGQARDRVRVGRLRRRAAVGEHALRGPLVVAGLDHARAPADDAADDA